MNENLNMEKLQKWCLKMTAVLGIMIFLVLTICSWYRTKTLLFDEFLKDHKDTIWKTVIVFCGVILLTCVVIKLERFFSAKCLQIIAIVFAVGAVLFSFFLMNSSKTYAVADPWYVYDAACRLAEGTFDIQRYSGYYQFYSFQLNLSQIYELLFRLTGSNSYRVIQGMQGICVGITVYMAFLITRELFGRRSAELICLILGILFVPMYIYILYIYGETLGTCCAMVAIWCFLKYNKCKSIRGILRYGILGIAAVAVFYQARVALVVVWIALMLIQLLITLVHKNYFPLVITIFMLITSVLVSRAFQNSIENRTGAVLDKRMPAVMWIAMGLQDSIEAGKSPGSYNAYNVTVFVQSGMDKKVSSEIAITYMKERLKELAEHPIEAFRFWGRKLMNQWNEPTYGCFIKTGFNEGMDEWVYELYYGKGNEKCLMFLNYYQAVVYLAVLSGFIRLVFGKREPQEALIGLILIGEFLFSMIWEADSKYVYPYAVIMIPFAACSLIHFSDLTLKKLKLKQEITVS